MLLLSSKLGVLRLHESIEALDGSQRHAVGVHCTDVLVTLLGKAQSLWQPGGIGQ